MSKPMTPSPTPDAFADEVAARAKRFYDVKIVPHRRRFLERYQRGDLRLHCHIVVVGDGIGGETSDHCAVVGANCPNVRPYVVPLRSVEINSTGDTKRGDRQGAVLIDVRQLPDDPEGMVETVGLYLVGLQRLDCCQRVWRDEGKPFTTQSFVIERLPVFRDDHELNALDVVGGRETVGVEMAEAERVVVQDRPKLMEAITGEHGNRLGRWQALLKDPTVRIYGRGELLLGNDSIGFGFDVNPNEICKSVQVFIEPDQLRVDVR